MKSSTTPRFWKAYAALPGPAKNAARKQCKRILKIIGFHAHDLDMAPSETAYKKWGNGKKVDLRFSKNGDPYLEKRYARNFKWNRKVSFTEYFDAKNNPEQGAPENTG